MSLTILPLLAPKVELSSSELIFILPDSAIVTNILDLSFAEQEKGPHRRIHFIQMAEMVGSAIVQETVSQIIACLGQKNEEEEESNVKRNLERLEMAHIRLEAALETSRKWQWQWQVTDASLLRWQRKLKRAAQECEDILQKCKQRILEDKQTHEEVRNSSLPNRIVHATKSLVLSVFKCDNNELSRSIVQRFEWYADSASEFLRFIELGGTPRRNMPFDSLVKNLLAGKGLHHRIVRGNEYPSFQLLLLPYNIAEHGKEATLTFIQKDGTPHGNICYSVIVQLSESTDIVGIAIKCLQLFAPHFNSTIENIRKELSQLHTQDLPWLPSICSYKKEQQGTLHSLGSQWFRPNPFCCKPHGHHDFQRISNIGIEGLADVSLEQVIEVNLQFQVSLSLNKKQKTPLTEDVISLQDSPYLKAEISFAPHGSSEAMLPANISTVVMAIVGEEQRCLHTDITLEQLEELMLPKATDYFHQNPEATAYQMIWKSMHGFAFVQIEKERMRTWRRPGPRKRKLLKQQDLELGSGTCLISRLLNSWSVHVPVRLQSLIMDSNRKKRGVS